MHFVLIGCVPASNRRARCHAVRGVADCAPDLAAVAEGLRAPTSPATSAAARTRSPPRRCSRPRRRRRRRDDRRRRPGRDADGLDWLAGQDDENVDELEAALAGGERLRALLERWRKEMPAGNDDSADDPAAALGSLVCDADRAAITPETSAIAATRRNHALAAETRCR